MIKLENFEVTGWEHAIRGMRNPMNSWEKSDSCCLHPKEYDCDLCSDKECDARLDDNKYCRLGPNDHELMMKLRNAGTDHRKFMRMITVYVDITAPLYWWKEFDTYKVGTVANSCSTMHKIHEKEFGIDDFSVEKMPKQIIRPIGTKTTREVFYKIIDTLNFLRNQYNETKDKTYWEQMIQLLPSSYNQKRTIMFNYEVLANIYKSRKNHKLDEWRWFCMWIEGLPYSELITAPAVNERFEDALKTYIALGTVDELKQLSKRIEERLKEENETSFQEDLEFFVNDCTNAQLKQLYERVGEKLKEKTNERTRNAYST